MGVPPCAAWAVTLQLAIVSPAGGVNVAVIGIGFVTTVPSAGDCPPIAGGACCGVPPLGAPPGPGTGMFQGTVSALDTERRPLTNAVASTTSVPAAAPT